MVDRALKQSVSLCVLDQTSSGVMVLSKSCEDIDAKNPSSFLPLFLHKRLAQPAFLPRSVGRVGVFSLGLWVG